LKVGLQETIQTWETCLTGTRAVVFVVDDDDSVRGSLKRLIRSLGLAVQTFASAEDFLRSPDAAAADCLILDMRMPGLSGLDLQQRLVQSSSRIPIIFISAHDDQEARSRAMKAGAIAFLQKPFEEEDLLEALCAALWRRRARRQDGGAAC
jgi:FixJ family two-component response regulator